ncbi:MAG: hypothetical protein EBS05_20675 [Proteobacteria bacterium]|nr:hypothetical protein [Pseudomonadota bacterium]
MVELPGCICARSRYNLRAMTAPIVVLWIYIVLLVAGGLVGFLKAGSKASLIASSIFALPLVLAALGIVPAVVAEVVLGILLVYMGMKYAKTKKVMPSGVMAGLSAVALVARFLLK